MTNPERRILAYGEAAGRAAQAATKTLPIVCVADDLVDSGLAADLAKPIRNMTGVSILATEIDAKKIEILFRFADQLHHHLVDLVGEPT